MFLGFVVFSALSCWEPFKEEVPMATRVTPVWRGPVAGADTMALFSLSFSGLGANDGWWWAFRIDGRDTTCHKKARQASRTRSSRQCNRRDEMGIR